MCCQRGQLGTFRVHEKADQSLPEFRDIFVALPKPSPSVLLPRVLHGVEAHCVDFRRRGPPRGGLAAGRGNELKENRSEVLLCLLLILRGPALCRLAPFLANCAKRVTTSPLSSRKLGTKCSVRRLGPTFSLLSNLHSR